MNPNNSYVAPMRGYYGTKLLESRTGIIIWRPIGWKILSIILSLELLVPNLNFGLGVDPQGKIGKRGSRSAWDIGEYFTFGKGSKGFKMSIQLL